MKYLYEARKRGARVLAVNTYKEPGLERYWIPSTLHSALFGTNITERCFVVTVGGVLAFLNAWSARDPNADFNGDGAVNTLDVLAFLNAWSVGC